MALVSVGLVLGAFELGLRLTGHEAIYEMYSKPSQFWRYDELLGWSHEPGASGEFVGPRPWPIEFRGKVSINSLGLRGPEIPPPDASELRVLFLGDSIVAGFEVDHDQTFVALLQALLRERLGVPVRTINAGVRGYGTDQDYLYFRERGWKLEPDLVVFFHSGNDPADNTTLHEMRRPFGKPALSLTAGGELELVGSPVPHYPSCSEVQLSTDYAMHRADTASGRLLCAAEMALFDHSALLSYLTLSVPWNYEFLKRLYYVGNPHAEHLKTGQSDTFEGRLTTAIVLALAKEVRSRGAAFLVTGYPSALPQLDPGALAAAEVALFPLAQIEDNLRELTWHHDGHFNPEGHRRMANLIAGQLEPLLRARVR
jgi:lysophospholipase L1-like esterase